MRRYPGARSIGRAGVISACGAMMLMALSQASRAGEPADLAAAKRQFLTSCGVCHTFEKGGGNRQGPNLATAYGRKAGTYPGFTYSKALKDGGWTWDEKNLDPWLENSQAAHPGTFMNYRQSSPDKRALVIAFLKSLQTPK